MTGLRDLNRLFIESGDGQFVLIAADVSHAAVVDLAEQLLALGFCAKVTTPEGVVTNYFAHPHAY